MSRNRHKPEQIIAKLRDTNTPSTALISELMLWRKALGSPEVAALYLARD
jgi:hypothetical protein